MPSEKDCNFENGLKDHPIIPLRHSFSSLSSDTHWQEDLRLCVVLASVIIEFLAPSLSLHRSACQQQSLANTPVLPPVTAEGLDVGCGSILQASETSSQRRLPSGTL